MADLPQFKSQPWVVFDTIAARSFLVGETRQEFQAFNSGGPAITAAGEMVYFSTPRTRALAPWYTSLELVGQLSYGFKAWAAYIHFGFPQTPSEQTFNPAAGAGGQVTISDVLLQAIINFGVLQLNLGQEQQASWPVHRFQAGGGLQVMGGNSIGGGEAGGQNAVPEGANVLKLPEPIEIPRTQNIDAKIKIAPEALPTIGTNAAPGVGVPLGTGAEGYQFNISEPPPGETVDLDRPPYTVQLGLIGERIKKTQYGQVPGEAG